MCRCLFDRNPPRSSQDSSSSEKSCSDSTFLGQTLTRSFYCQHKRPQIFWLCLRLQLLLSLREPLRDPVTEHHSRCPGPSMSSTSLDMDALEWISACKNHPTPPQTPTYFIHSYVHTHTNTRGTPLSLTVTLLLTYVNALLLVHHLVHSLNWAHMLTQQQCIHTAHFKNNVTRICSKQKLKYTWFFSF